MNDIIQVIALLARAGHGKTTIANHCRDKYGVTAVSLASPLKRIAQAAMGFSDEQLYGTQAQKEAAAYTDANGRTRSTRHFLQQLATEGIRRNLGEMVWCEALLYNIKKDHEATGQLMYVVDDVRFIDEVKFIKSLATHPEFLGHTIRILCPDAPPSGNDNHQSEREVDSHEILSMIDCTVVSTRAQGVEHLIQTFEERTRLPGMAAVRAGLDRLLAVKSTREEDARRLAAAPIGE